MIKRKQSLTRHDFARAILDSRRGTVKNLDRIPIGKSAEEGGCGVVGFASSVPVGGRHIYEPSIQMNNRGNGKGGGIACAGLDAAQMGVDAATLRDNYILQIALLDSDAAADIERDYVLPNFDIAHKTMLQPEADWKAMGMPVRPPDIVRYFVRVKDNILKDFTAANKLEGFNLRDVEDEFVYRNSFQLNQQYYASLGDQRAFVLSHARDLMIFKIVGFAENVVQYYGLEDLQAHVWIAHQRYPTKGRVWHPAGSHPFIGMNEALVHNGDFANYYSVSEYLRQHNIVPQFLTDTEVAVLQFDLLNRVYKYPQEYIIEALAPTAELDIDRLPETKRQVYQTVQSQHMHGSPDGPWFFIIARSNPDEGIYRLLGITDTAMLRPQVFALQEGDVSIGLIGSEKQAIDATLLSLSREDSRFRLVADRYWNARGGSHTDGGAFSFTVTKKGDKTGFDCADKFGQPVTAPSGEYRIDTEREPKPNDGARDIITKTETDLVAGSAVSAYERIIGSVSGWNLDGLRWALGEISHITRKSDACRDGVLELLTMLGDRNYDCGQMRRSAVIELIRAAITSILNDMPAITNNSSSRFARVDWESREQLRAPQNNEDTLVIYSHDFPPEGDDCDACLTIKAYETGWRRFIIYGLKGQRFHGCGLGKDTDGVSLDIYGSSGDYIASGCDGAQIYLHDNAQDQLGQIMKRGKLVVYGDVGQTFLYGAKGGDVYVKGNAAGRPLINAVGRPRVVINGTCLDFLAESFMAGDPHNGGGFVILNGVKFDDSGRVRSLPLPYPGSNLFSMASGGAIFVRDPHFTLVAEQLNGGDFAEFSEADWDLILPYLAENERLFGISIERDLLTVDDDLKEPSEVYRKIVPRKLPELAKADTTE
jgi:glutamate synthase domain-containing protein 1/glutamate synthase domain-containing protein 3